MSRNAPDGGSTARASGAIAIVFASLGAVALPSRLSMAAGVLGPVVLAAGVLRATERPIHYGTLLLAIGVLIAGVEGAPPEPLVLCTLLSLLAWDAGRYGIRIGSQLGRAANTTRIELAHSAVTMGIGVVGSGLGYAAYRVATGGQPVLALLLLSIGAVTLLFTLR